MTGIALGAAVAAIVSVRALTDPALPLAVRILIGVLVLTVLALALYRPSQKAPMDTPPESGDDQ